MNREFLYELLETASVSGFEEEIQRKVIKYARGFADEIYTDEIADVVSIVNPDAEIKKEYEIRLEADRREREELLKLKT